MADAEELRGTAVKVFDGDSFVLKLQTGGEVEVRLGEIDAPEKEQPHAEEARAALRALISGRELKLTVIDVDPYRRKVARVRCIDPDLDINAEMIRRGHAWVYRRWVRDKSLYDMERQARAAKLGLWALPEFERTPPWRWRRDHPPARAQAPAPSGG